MCYFIIVLWTTWWMFLSSQQDELQLTVFVWPVYVINTMLFTPTDLLLCLPLSRWVWRYQREVIRIRISKKNRQRNGQTKKYKQRSTKHTYKTKDRVRWTPLKTGDELRCSIRVGSSCFTSDTRRVNLVTNPVISHERGNEREVFTTGGTYQAYWSIS